MENPSKSNHKKRSYFVHESSYIDKNVRIGPGTKIWHFGHILGGSVIGKNCNIGQNVMVGPDVVIGNNVKIQNNVSVYQGVTLEDDVFCGPSCVFTNVINPRSHIIRKHEIKKTLVKKGATIGANCTIVCGNSIGKYAFLAAGAVIVNDVPDYALMMGVPAKLKGYLCQCGHRLVFKESKTLCKICNKQYLKTPTVVKLTKM